VPKSSSPRLLHRVRNGPNVMCLRIRSLPDPISSTLNSPLSASRILVNCGHFFTCKVRVRNSAAQSVQQLCSEGPGSGRRASKPLRNGVHHDFAVRERPQSGSRVLDPKTTTWIFTGPIEGRA
jgi:hypothetical protein